MTKNELKAYAEAATTDFVDRYRKQNEADGTSQVPNGAYDELRRELQKRVELIAQGRKRNK